MSPAWGAVGLRETDAMDGAELATVTLLEARVAPSSLPSLGVASSVIACPRSKWRAPSRVLPDAA